MKVLDLKEVDATKNKMMAPTPPFAPIVGVTLTDLPSKGLPYPKGAQVKFRPMGYGEVQKLNGSRLLSRLDRMKFILDGIDTEGFEKKDLSYFDYLYIGVLRKMSSIDKSKFRIGFTCIECDNYVDTVMDLDTIEFSDLEIPSLPVFVPFGEKDHLQITALSVGSYMELLESDQLEDTVATYAKSVLNYSFDEAYKIIETATEELCEDLENVDRMLHFGKQTVDCKCTECSAINKKELEDLIELIQPFRRGTESTRSRIHFGQARDN